MLRSRPAKTVMPSLTDLPFVAGRPRRERAIIDRHTTLLEVPAGATLCREGTPGREAFLIVRGEAEVTVGDVTIAHLAAGSLCGELALVDRSLRSATVVAATPMAVLAISIAEFETLRELVPSFNRRLLDTLAGRIREANKNGGSGPPTRHT